MSRSQSLCIVLCEYNLVQDRTRMMRTVAKPLLNGMPGYAHELRLPQESAWLAIAVPYETTRHNLVYRFTNPLSVLRSQTRTATWALPSEDSQSPDSPSSRTSPQTTPLFRRSECRGRDLKPSPTRHTLFGTTMNPGLEPHRLISFGQKLSGQCTLCLPR